MAINAHAHIFNAVSVVTQETKQILLNRLLDMLPEWLVNRVDAAIPEDPGSHQPLASAAEMSRKIFNTLKGDSNFKTQFDHMADDEDKEALERLLNETDDSEDDTWLARLFSWLETQSYIWNASTTTLMDALEFVIIALQPRITDVAKMLMGQHGPNDIVVALTMDITAGNGSDDYLYESQLRETKAVADEYNDRLLPFVCLNPLRPNMDHYYDLAFNHLDYKGVKIYPSLGYDPTNPALGGFFEECTAKGRPVLTHCNIGGFRATEADGLRCDPRNWTQVLKDHPNLKLCFGHFGGEEYLTVPDILEVEDNGDNWARSILALMEIYPHVYADISHHTKTMAGGQEETNYLENIRGLLNNETYGSRILFGSDFWMVRRVMREKSFITYFKRELRKRDYKAMAQTNPSAFLGLDQL